jgi:hypothetical protein
MKEDTGNEGKPQVSAEPPKREPILLNWLITLVALGVIALVAVWLQ